MFTKLKTALGLDPIQKKLEEYTAIVSEINRLEPDYEKLSDEALRAKEAGKETTIVFNLSGHGHLDLASYEKYFAGELTDYHYPTEKIEEALKHLPKIG